MHSADKQTLWWFLTFRRRSEAMTRCSNSSTHCRALMSVSIAFSCTCQGCCRASSNTSFCSTFNSKRGSSRREHKRQVIRTTWCNQVKDEAQYQQHSPLTGLVHISAKLSMCLAKCLWSTLSLMPLGWRHCKVLYSSSGSLIHHQPRTIAVKESNDKLQSVESINTHRIHLMNGASCRSLKSCLRIIQCS